MKWILPALLLTNLISSLAQGANGDQLRGQVSRNANGELIYRHIPDKSIWTLKTASPTLKKDLESLQNGDFILGEGNFYLDTETVVLESIYTVGLRRLLGLWGSDKLHFFNFENFEKFIHITPPAFSSKAETYEYALVPESKDKWTLFLRNVQSVKIGALTYNPKDGKDCFKLQLIDSEKGGVLESHVLKRW